MKLELEPLDSDDQPKGKAQFGERAPKSKYTGVEHRHFVRRVCADRRMTVRFEPEKAGFSSGADRRSRFDRRAIGRWNSAYSV